MAAKIETVEGLETKLQEDLAWRKKEMLSIKMMADKGDANESILLRSGITMLCKTSRRSCLEKKRNAIN